MEQIKSFYIKEFIFFDVFFQLYSMLNVKLKITTLRLITR